MDFVFNSILDVFKVVKICSGSKVVILIIGGFFSEVFFVFGKFIFGEDFLGMLMVQLYKVEVVVYVVGV